MSIRKNGNLIASVLTVLLILMCGQLAVAKTVNVKVLKVEARNIKRQGEYVGTFKPNRSLMVSSTVEGEVIKNQVKEGQKVKKGTTLVVIENERLSKQIEIAELNMKDTLNSLIQEELNLKQKLISLEKDKESLSLNQRKWERQKNLYDKQLASKESLENVENVLVNSRFQAELSESALSLIESDISEVAIYKKIQQQLDKKTPLAKLKVDLKYKGFYPPMEIALVRFKNAQKSYNLSVIDFKNSIITAPITATIIDDYDLEYGKYLNKGAVVVELADISKMQVEVGVKETDINFIKIGSKGSITLDALSGKKVTATVKKIGLQANSKNRTFPITLEVANSKNQILSGMTARITLLLESLNNKIFIPTASIINKPQGSIVFISSNGKALAVNVKTGRIHQGLTEITKGLKSGALLVTSGQTFLNNGDVTTIISR